MSISTQRAYQCAPGISWVKDAKQTILVDEGTGRSWLLSGWRAAVWDLLVLGYLAKEVVPFLSLLLDIPPETAGKMLVAVLHEWKDEGILSSAVEGGDG